MQETTNANELQVLLPAGDITLTGSLLVPQNPAAVVLFAHGSGSSRKSPRNKFIANVLCEHNIAALLLDLLTPSEKNNFELGFDIDLLSKRILSATKWLQSHPDLHRLPIGYFGSDTGGAAAIEAAALAAEQIGAVVSRGGRPDMAEQYLSRIKAPTLLIVASNDDIIVKLNQQAAQRMLTVHRLDIVPDATHFFEESGKLAIVAKLTVQWFEKHLGLVSK